MSADFTLAERLVAAYPLQKVSTRRGTISYREAGAGSALCLLHGIGSQSGSWVPQLDTLAARFHVIAWDAPGYGESDQILADPPATSDYANSLVGLLDALGIDRVLLVGNSLGALIAGAFAAMQPDRVVGLVLLSPAGGYGLADASERDAKLAARLQRLSRLGPQGMAQDLPAGMLSQQASAEALSLAAWSTARIRPDGYGRAARMLACGRLVEEAKKYPGPVLVIAGTHDDITPAAGSERIARAFQRGTFRLLEGAGHLCFLDAPAVISSAITDMAQRCVEERIHERS
jgi:pimeloyl-ACP methyl ester carboxylesterase